MQSNRDELQKQARDAWYKNGCRGTISGSVGFGKTWVAIDIHNELWFSGLKTLLVTPTIVLHEVNWKTEYEKAQCEVLYHTLDRACYVSLFKYNPNDYDLIILDEAHSISKANYEEFLRFINPEKTKVLALTGTPPKKGQKKDWFDACFPVVFSSDINSSADSGIVNEFVVNVLLVDLDNHKKNIAAGSKTKPFMTTERGSYDYWTHKVETAIYRGTQKDVQWMSLSRKRFLENLESRMTWAKKIRDSFLKSKKSIIFAPTIEKAKLLCKDAIHSKVNGAQLLEDFKNDKIKMLSSVRMLNEGVTLPNLEAGLICKLDSTDKTVFQQIGRLLRNPNGVSQIYIIVYRDTVEHRYLNQALQSISKERINYLKPEQL